VTIEHKVKAIRAILAALSDAMRDLEADIIAPVKYAPGNKRLLVPWIGQNTDRTDDDYTKNDCGAAVVAMVVNCYRGGNGVTVDEVSKATGKAPGYTAASFQELINAAARFNVTLEHVAYTLEQICADLDTGKPVIVIVNYKSLPLYNRYDAAYNAGHYVVVVGYEDDCILYHDPYWKAADRGAYRSLTHPDFERAYTTVAPGNTRAPHALRVLA
jgi:ABC-type bacteriocin/lantibiotic exporter with double-glycine peptidase domain